MGLASPNAVLALLVVSVAGSPCSCGCCAVSPGESAPVCALVGDSCAGECEPEGSAAPVATATFCYDDCRPSSHHQGASCDLLGKLDKPLAAEVRAVEPSPVDPSKPVSQEDSRGGESEAVDQAMLSEAALRRAAAARARKAPVEAPVAKAKLSLVKQPSSEVTPTQLQLAKSAMLEAKVHAKAAGAAARRAKESYELAMRSAREMAEYAGRLAYDEIQREAGEQSKKALKIRNDYVAAAQKAGIANAKAAAAPYKKAAVVATNTAAMWNMRAGEFAASAGALKSQAAGMAADAQKYTETQDWADAESFSRQAHQLVAQSQEMADRADSAHTQANAVQQTMNWYALAGRGTAASVLAGSMPYDVPPPPLPNTVFL